MKKFLLLCMIFMTCLIKYNHNEENNNHNILQLSKSVEQNNVYDYIDSYLYDMCAKAHFPAMSVTIVDKNNVLLSKTYGSCKDTNVPFFLGSVSKSFTALCIMQLVEQNKIELDQNFEAYLPNYAYGDKITVRQLLNHTSGLGEYQSLENYKIIGKQGEHKYANVNYSILGKIIEETSGLSYEEYVEKNIFNPLLMTKSSVTLEKAIENGLVDSYNNWFGINAHAKPKYPSSDTSWITAPAGYLASSTSDLGKYLQMYLNGGSGIISQDSINKMFYENVSVEANIPYKYGMGWNLINEPLKQPALRHSGLIETGMSTIYILPDSEIGIAIVVNTNDYFVGKDMMDRIDWSIALMLMGEKPNNISNNEYLLKHILYDMVYFIVFIISLLPLFLLNHFKANLSKKKLGVKLTLLGVLHLLLPIFLILLPQLFFATPLWVVKAFVPDMFFTIILSSCLLFIGGIIKIILLISNKIKCNKI